MQSLFTSFCPEPGYLQWGLFLEAWLGLPNGCTRVGAPLPLSSCSPKLIFSQALKINVVFNSVMKVFSCPSLPPIQWNNCRASCGAHLGSVLIYSPTPRGLCSKGFFLYYVFLLQQQQQLHRRAEGQSCPCLQVSVRSPATQTHHLLQLPGDAHERLNPTRLRRVDFSSPQALFS